MKRALSFIIIYVASMTAGSLLLATLFMCSCNLTMLVTGLRSFFFSPQLFLTGLLTSFPLVCVLTHILLVLYVIRHPAKKIVSLILYAALGAVSWLVLIPADLHLISRHENDIVSTRTDASSAGFFRAEDNGIVYYSRVGDGTADGLFIDTVGVKSQENKVVPFFNAPIKNDSAFPYSDILIKNSLRPPLLVAHTLAVYSSLLAVARHSHSLGFFAWLAFASVGLALLSVYGLQSASSWRLANVIFVMCATFAILALNYLYYQNIMPDALRDAAAKLAEFTGAKDSLVIIINLFISAVFIVSGVFMGIYRYGTAVSDSEDE